jgi:hypothetical protein
LSSLGSHLGVLEPRLGAPDWRPEPISGELGESKGGPASASQGADAARGHPGLYSASGRPLGWLRGHPGLCSASGRPLAAARPLVADRIVSGQQFPLPKLQHLFVPRDPSTMLIEVFRAGTDRAIPEITRSGLARSADLIILYPHLNESEERRGWPARANVKPHEQRRCTAIPGPAQLGVCVSLRPKSRLQYS